MAITFNTIDATNGFSPLNGKPIGFSSYCKALTGNDRYAVGTVASGPNASLQVLYKSADGGVTWSVLDNTCPFSPNTNNWDQLLPLADGSGLLYVQEQGAGSSPNSLSSDYRSSTFTFTSATWSASDDYGFKSGFLDGTYETWGVSLRPDGTRILVGQNPAYGTGNGISYQEGIIIRKRDAAGTWTTLGTIGDLATEIVMVLGQPAMMADGTVHVMLATVPYDAIDFWGAPWALEHISISPADVVSSRTVVDANLDGAGAFNTKKWTENYSQGLDISADEKTICFAYVPENQGNYTNGGSVPSDLKVAFGDLTVSKLTPSWSTTTAVLSTDTGAPCAITNSFLQLGLSFGSVGVVVVEKDHGASIDYAKYSEQANDVNKPAVYWLSNDPHFDDFFSVHYWRLFSTKWNGSSWSSPPTIEYTPSGWDSLTPAMSVEVLRLILNPHGGRSGCRYRAIQ